MRMSRTRLVAASIVIALAVSPTMLDACQFTCHGSAAADEANNEPSCHHAVDDADLRIQPPAAPCGHDHSPAPTTTTAKLSGADARSNLDAVICELPVQPTLTKTVAVVNGHAGFALDSHN